MPLTADCAGLVAATAAVAENVNALREQIICLNEILRESLLTKDAQLNFWNLAQVNNSIYANMLRDAIQTSAGMIARTAPPELPTVNILQMTIEDVPLHNDCSSQFYCLPGYYRNEQGVCVPVEQ